MKFIIILLFIIILPSFAWAQYTYNDGPYVFTDGDSLLIQWVEDGEARDTLIHKENPFLFSIPGLPEVDLSKLALPKQDEARFTTEKLTVISDVHGQFDVLTHLLRQHQVIDSLGRWVYGEGHVVVVGDNMDRGDKVIEILWFLFRLEKEALAAGGRLHVILGNHEMMVLNGDLRYIHKKYRYTSGAFITPYYKFFRKGSVLGDWIANQKVAVIINDKLFVHAGISPELAGIRMSIKKLNKIFRKEILRQPYESIDKDNLYAYLYHTDGPLWYRGYFGEDKISEGKVDTILDNFTVERMVIGHTTQDSILTKYDNKVIVVDCGIKFGDKGQVLIEEEGRLYIGKYDGTREHLIKSKQSLFHYLYDMSGKPIIHLTTDVNHIIKNRRKEEYQEVLFELFDASKKSIFSLPGKIRTRGNMRKQVCYYPPFKIDFKKSALDSMGMNRNDKLKLVLPCRKGGGYQERLYKEYFLYDLYRLIDSNGMKAKLVELHLLSDKEEKYTHDGFIIEDEGAYEIRKDAQVITEGKVNSSVIDQVNFHKLVLFEYMISNTDWAIMGKHNLEMFMFNENHNIVAIPYDFDYAGLVGQPYALPGKGLPIGSIHDRYFFAYKVSEKLFLETVDYYKAKEEEIYALCDSATYMKEDTREKIKNYIEDFYDLLDHPSRLLRQLTVDDD